MSLANKDGYHKDMCHYVLKVYMLIKPGPIVDITGRACMFTSREREYAICLGVNYASEPEI